MKQRIFLCSIGLAAMIAAVPAHGQTAAKSAVKSDAPFAAKTPWGDPDIQGTWTSDDTWGVPFERPKNFGTRATLTEDELKDRQKRVQQSEEFVDTGGPNAHSPAVAELQAKEKGEAPPAPAQRGFGRGV